MSEGKELSNEKEKKCTQETIYEHINNNSYIFENSKDGSRNEWLILLNYLIGFFFLANQSIVLKLLGEDYPWHQLCCLLFLVWVSVFSRFFIILSCSFHQHIIFSMGDTRFLLGLLENFVFFWFELDQSIFMWCSFFCLLYIFMGLLDLWIYFLIIQLFMHFCLVFKIASSDNNIFARGCSFFHGHFIQFLSAEQCEPHQFITIFSPILKLCWYGMIFFYFLHLFFSRWVTLSAV